MTEVLPLALSPFEQFVLDTDRPAGRLQFFARVRFGGRLDREAFTRAAEATLARHPLCSARLGATASGERAWIPGPPGLPLDWRDEAEEAPALAPQSLEQAPGLEVFVRAGARQSILGLRVHHAICDGHGTVQLLDDFLSAYSAAAGSPHAPAPALEPGLLAGRARFGMTPQRAVRALPRQLLGLIGVRRALFRHPVAIAAAESERVATPTQGGVWGEVCASRLDRAASMRLRQAARRQGVREHDLLLRDLFLTLGAAASSGGSLDRRRWLRLSIPVDLRTFEQRHMPAANVVSQVFLDRRMGDLERPAALLRGLHAEMGLILAWRLALTFVAALRLGRALPVLWPAIVGHDPRLAPTALVTHLGTLSGRRGSRTAQGRLLAGGLELESIEVIAPLPPHVPLAFALYRYAGELHVTLRFDPAVFSAAAARALLDAWLARLEASAA